MLSEIENKEIDVNDKEGRLHYRSLIEQFESAMKKEAGSDRGCADEINEDGLVEHFVGGAYIRQLFVPKDRAIVSKLWKKDRLWIIASGEISLTTEAGNTRIKAPYVGVPMYGSKVAFYTHEDTLWFAITGAESTNSEDVEKELIVSDYDKLTYPWDLLTKEGEKS